MNIDARALWDECLVLIRDNVTEQQFNTWFKPIDFESYDDATKSIVLRLPSSFIYEYLEEHYVDLLNKVLTKYFGKNVRLAYRVIVDKSNSKDVKVEANSAPQSKNQTSSTSRVPSVLDAALPQLTTNNLDVNKDFESYVEGDSNKLPRSIGLSIAENPKTTQFNPMFIYGPTGCGKTHLINAIGLKALEVNPSLRVLYISARLFHVQFTKAVLSNTTPDFINFYQTIDMLIVDDVQEWANQPKTQDTFFHIFNHLFRLGKRIILASDRPPVDLSDIKDRLLTRFSCGLIAEMERPNFKLCVDILKRKIKREGLRIPEDVVLFIAQNASYSVRNLEGIINSLLAFSITYNSEIDMRLAERVIKRTVNISDSPITLEDILSKVCTHYNVTHNAVASKSRRHDNVVARQVSMYLAKKYTKLPEARIGKMVGGRDHSTVVYSCAQVEKRLKVDKMFSSEVASIENSFKLKK